MCQMPGEALRYRKKVVAFKEFMAQPKESDLAQPAQRTEEKLAQQSAERKGQEPGKVMQRRDASLTWSLRDEKTVASWGRG